MTSARARLEEGHSRDVGNEEQAWPAAAALPAKADNLSAPAT